MSCVIMQPTFIPWSGYFNLISRATNFIYLDDVQFEKQSWQSRNAILLNKERFLVRLAVSRGPLERKINQVELSSEKDWRIKLVRTLKETYGKHPFNSALEPVLAALENDQLTNLSDFNITIIEDFCNLLGLKTKRLRSSSLNIPGKRSEKIIALCKHLTSDEYLSPIGAKNYLEEDNFFSNSSIKLTFQNFNPQPYPQIGSKNFVSHLSILDIIANIGPKSARSYIESGVYSPQEVTSYE